MPELTYQPTTLQARPYHRKIQVQYMIVKYYIIIFIINKTTKLKVVYFTE